MMSRRLSHIFRSDGRALIAAFDHGLIDGPIKGIERPAETLAKIVAGGADAVLTSFGTAVRFAQLLAPVGLILRIDGGGTKLGKMGPGAQFHSVEAALRLGADALAVSAFPGAANELETLRVLSQVIDEAHAWDIPVMAEMQPGGFDSGPEYSTTENIALSARVAAELGADWVKAPYAPEYRRVVEACYIPVVMLGGARKSYDRHMLENIKAAVDAGAAGVAIGRNIFQSDDPERMTAAVAAIVHGNATVDAAMAVLAG